MEGERETWHEKAKQALQAGRKDKALMCLKIKKSVIPAFTNSLLHNASSPYRYKDEQLTLTDGQLIKLEELVGVVPWVSW